MFLFTSIIDVMSIFRTLLLLLSSIQRVSADSAAASINKTAASLDLPVVTFVAKQQDTAP